jgi:hypothetical protein
VGAPGEDRTNVGELAKLPEGLNCDDGVRWATDGDGDGVVDFVTLGVHEGVGGSSVRKDGISAGTSITGQSTVLITQVVANAPIRQSPSVDAITAEGVPGNTHFEKRNLELSVPPLRVPKSWSLPAKRQDLAFIPAVPAVVPRTMR